MHQASHQAQGEATAGRLAVERDEQRCQRQPGEGRVTELRKAQNEEKTRDEREGVTEWSRRSQRVTQGLN